MTISKNREGEYGYIERRIEIIQKLGERKKTTKRQQKKGGGSEKLKDIVKKKKNKKKRGKKFCPNGFHFH